MQAVSSTQSFLLLCKAHVRTANTGDTNCRGILPPFNGVAGLIVMSMKVSTLIEVVTSLTLVEPLIYCRVI